MDMSKIQRALGFIEGVCAGLKEKEAELIEEAIVEIDCELENAAGDSTTGIPFGHHVALQGIDPRKDNRFREEKQEMCSGLPEVTAKLVAIEPEDYLSASQMDELEERLQKHFTDYINGKTQNFKLVCCDCIQALVAITQLKEQLKDREYCACAERP